MAHTEHIIYTQVYEIRTKAGAEVDSKGNIKPSAQVEITRNFVLMSNVIILEKDGDVDGKNRQI